MLLLRLVELLVLLLLRLETMLLLRRLESRLWLLLRWLESMLWWEAVAWGDLLRLAGMHVVTGTDVHAI